MIFEPYNARTPLARDPILRLCCLDASIALAPVLQRFRNVIVTSGTLSPINTYTKILNFTPKVIWLYRLFCQEFNSHDGNDPQGFCRSRFQDITYGFGAVSRWVCGCEGGGGRGGRCWSAVVSWRNVLRVCGSVVS